MADNVQSRHPLDQPPAKPQSAADEKTFTPSGAMGSVDYEDTVSEGTLIADRYKLRQQIGEGGMGTVWMADQTEPINRRVAVKLIRVERGQSNTILARPQ
jgi:hypothetical protein